MHPLSVAELKLSSTKDFESLLNLGGFPEPFFSGSQREAKRWSREYRSRLVREEVNSLERVLLKWVHFQEDSEGRELDLKYFRDIDGREVDFVVTENNKPIVCIEVKYSDTTISKSLRYFKERFPSCEAFQLVMTPTRAFQSVEGIRLSPALSFLSSLS